MAFSFYRDSAAFAYSAFSLQTLQSPPPMLGLKSTLTHSGGGSRAAALATTSSSSSSRLGSSVLLDSMDQTLLLHLTSLQANQLEDLANVLLPHLTVDPRAGGSSSAPTPPAGPLTASEGGETAMLLEPLDVSNTMEYGDTQPRQLKDKVKMNREIKLFGAFSFLQGLGGMLPEYGSSIV
jgi:hypothetical protein